ncbi:MAG: 30S ribosomal protein S27e [Candidatus Aenigmatarchaeota archaeon]
MKESIEMPKSKFLRVACRKCKNEQVVFSKAATLVKCMKCDAELVVPAGGESEIKGKVLQQLS